MKSLLTKFLALLLLFSVVIILAVGIRKGRERLASAPVWRPKPVPIVTEPVERRTLRQTLSYLARLEPLATAEIVSRITARIETIHVDEGDKVKAGQLLAELDDRDMQAQADAIEARLRSQEARLKANQATLKAAQQNASYQKKEYQRHELLFRKNSTSESAMKTARNEWDSAVGKLLALEEESQSISQEIKALSAQRDEAKIRLSYARILAPHSGTIRRRYLEVGDMAKPETPLFSLIDLSAYRLVFDLVQEDLRQVHEGQRVLIDWPFEAPEAEREGTLARIFPALETGKTVRAEVDLFCTCPQAIKAGAFVPVGIVVREESGLTIPRKALIPHSDEKWSVYLERSGKLESVAVEVGFSDERRSLIRGNIEEGDRVVVGEYLQWVRRYHGQPVETDR